MIPGFPDGVSAAEWSPDGKRLSVRAPGGVQRYIVGKKDDPTARVMNDVFWRLDGEGVLDQVDAVWVTNANGTGKPKRLTEPDIPVLQAIWSPDGRRIAFTADRGPDRTTLPLEQAWSVPAGGGSIRPLVEFDGLVVSIAWGDGWHRVRRVSTRTSDLAERATAGRRRSIDALARSRPGPSRHGVRLQRAHRCLLRFADRLAGPRSPRDDHHRPGRRGSLAVRLGWLGHPAGR